MGISSLNSAILYIVSLYFNPSSRAPTVISSEQSEPRNLNHANITNIPNLVHENTPFCGQKAHFDVRIHKTALFVDKTQQSKVAISVHQLNCVKAVR